MPVQEEKREPSKMECFAKKMEMYNWTEQMMVDFSAGGTVICFGVLHLAACVLMPEGGSGLMETVFMFFTPMMLFLLYFGVGSHGTDVYFKIGNPLGKRRQALSWAVRYEPVEWKEYYKIVWKKLLSGTVFSEAVWLVFSLLAIPVSRLISGEWRQPAYVEYVFAMWLLGAGMMPTGLYAGFWSAKRLEEQRRRHVGEQDTKWIRMKKAGERKTAGGRDRAVRAIYAVVMGVIVTAVNFIPEMLSFLPTEEIAYRRWGSLYVPLAIGFLMGGANIFAEVIFQIREKTNVEWQKLAVLFLGIAVFFWGVSSYTTFYEEHVVMKTAFWERSYDYRDAKQYIIDDSYGEIQLTIQFENRESEVFGYKDRYSPAFYERMDGGLDFEYAAYLAGQLNAAGVQGKVIDKAAIEEHVTEWEDEDVSAAWKRILELAGG